MSIYNDNLLLIHIPKCGGKSARKYLKAHLPNYVDSLNGGSGKLPIDSTPLRYIEEYTGRPLDSWKKIVIPIRDPYAHAVSHWSFHRDSYATGGGKHFDGVASHCRDLAEWLDEPKSDFRLFFEKGIRKRPLDEVERLMASEGFYEYYSTVNGVVPPNVEFIRCETMSEDFPNAVKEFVVNSSPFPRENVSPHSNPMEYYRERRTHDLLYERYKWAFKMFYNGKREEN